MVENMASVPVSPIDSIADYLMCSIHHDLYVRPKTLPCQHVFCEDCIGGWIERRGKLICPECQTEHIMPVEGVHGLPNNVKIASLCDYVNQTTQAEDLKEMKPCEHHPGNTLEIICYECILPACKLCISTIHTGHKTFPVKQYVEQIGNPLDVLAANVRRQLQDVSQSCETVGIIRADLKANFNRAMEESQRQRNILRKKLDAAFENTMSMVETTFRQKDNVLSAQLESLTGARKDFSNGLEISERVIRRVGLHQPESLMSVTGQEAWSHLRHLLLKQMQLGPRENSSLAVTWNNDVQEVLDSGYFGRVETKPIPKATETILLVLQQMKVRENTEISVQLKDGFNNAIDARTQPVRVTGHISTPTKHTIALNFSAVESGNLVASFKPNYIGIYKAYVRLFGDSVKNYPLKMLVPPRGRCFMNFATSSSMNQPHDVIVHDGNYIIADKGNCQVIVVEEEGRVITRFGKPSVANFDQLDPYAICWSGSTFLVSSLKNHCVVEYDANYAPWRVFGRKDLTAPTGIAVDNRGFVFVADDKQGHIVVFNEERRKHMVLSKRGSQPGELLNPWYMAFNSKNHLVIADSGNYRIQVLDPTSGNPIQLIDVYHGNGRAKCRGLALDSHDNIYVTSRHTTKRFADEKVSVYTREGDYLGAIGDGFRLARGLTVVGEEIPMVLVVDGNNARIKGYIV